MGPLVMYLTPMKWLWNPHGRNPEKNIMRMEMHKIVEQMGKAYPELGKNNNFWKFSDHDIKLKAL
jgi:hypothetical protein